MIETTKPIYLDNCATTRIDPNVLQAMIPYFDEHYGNAASDGHAFGWEAQDAVQLAKQRIASLIGASHRELVLTSGATESNNLAIAGYARANRSKGRHLITCVTEHKSVLDTCKQLEREGFEVTLLPVDCKGRIKIEDLIQAVRPDTILVSIMFVNNETGAIQPIRQIADVCRRRDVALHVDATQAAGKLPIEVRGLNVDLLSLSAHKIYGPKGVGALFVRGGAPRVQLEAMIHGGGHQGGMRSGTLPVPLIVGFGEACRIAQERMIEEAADTAKLRDELECLIVSQVPNAKVNGDPAQRSPMVTSISFANVDGEALLTDLVGIAASSGSACNSASAQPSYVLTAMGLSNELSRATLRLSVGRFTTRNQVVAAAEIVVETIRRLTAIDSNQPAAVV